MPDFPLVSVIIPAYNGASYIRHSINSVITQTYKHWELIVVDDGSSDDTGTIVRSYGDCVQYFYQENQGVGAARNRGIQEARGEWIAFLDQDDFFLPGKLNFQIKAIKDRPNVGIVHSGWQITDRQGTAVSSVEPWHGIPALNLKSWLSWKPVFLGAMLFRRNWLERAGGFNAYLHQVSDVDLVLRLALMGCDTVWFPHVVVGYRQHGNNVSCDVTEQVAECEDLLNNLFKVPNLPQEVLECRNKAQYNNLVWSAWRLYSAGHFSAMLDCLLRSLYLSTLLKTETVLDWISQFKQFEVEYGRKLDVSLFSQLLNWSVLLS